jgi:hypothetical protein
VAQRVLDVWSRVNPCRLPRLVVPVLHDSQI